MQNLLLIFVAMLLCGCVIAPQQKIVSAESENSFVKCEIGDAIELEIETNPSTGFAWEVKNPETRQVMLESRERKEEDSFLVGKKAIEKFVFRCVNKGVVEIEIVYKRAWEKEYIKCCKLKVEVD